MGQEQKEKEGSIIKIDRKHNMMMTRGDTEYIQVSCPRHPFAEGDLITFTVRKNFAEKKMIEKKVQTFTAEGAALIHIAPQDTAEMEFAKYVYDIQLTRKDGTVKTIVRPAVFQIGREVSYDD